MNVERVLQILHWKMRSSLCTHALNGWMPATKTHPACTILEDGMWLPQWLDYKTVTHAKISPKMMNPWDRAGTAKEEKEEERLSHRVRGTTSVQTTCQPPTTFKSLGGCSLQRGIQTHFPVLLARYRFKLSPSSLPNGQRLTFITLNTTKRKVGRSGFGALHQQQEECVILSLQQDNRRITSFCLYNKTTRGMRHSVFTTKQEECVILSLQQDNRRITSFCLYNKTTRGMRHSVFTTKQEECVILSLQQDNKRNASFCHYKTRGMRHSVFTTSQQEECVILSLQQDNKRITPFCLYNKRTVVVRWLWTQESWVSWLLHCCVLPSRGDVKYLVGMRAGEKV